MPHRLNEFRALVTFTSSARMPRLIHLAAKASGYTSNADYLRNNVAECVARDLGMDAEELKKQLPPNRENANPNLNTTRKSLVGSGNTYEEVQ